MGAKKPQRPAPGHAMVLPRVGDSQSQRAFDQIKTVAALAQKTAGDLAAKVSSIGALPFVVGALAMPSGVETVVRHNLGRAPVAVITSVIRGGLGGIGVITDLGDTYSGGAVNRAQFVVLQADAYGGTITVDVAFF